MPELTACRALGLPAIRAAGPVTSSTPPARSRANTTQDMPAASGLLNETAIECAVGVLDEDGVGEGEGVAFFEAEVGDGDGDGDDVDGDEVFFPEPPVWWSTS
jgi:hypothetical protein